MKPFAILGTPRSRTTWFSKFLSHGDTVCEHEPSKHWSRPSEIRDYFLAGGGASDSMLTLWWPVILGAPHMRAVVVFRPRREIIRSARDLGIEGDQTKTLVAIENAILSIACFYPRVPIVPFADLTPRRCAAIFRYLLRRPCPADWLERWSSVIVEPDVAGAMTAINANRPGIAALYGGLL